MRECGLEALDKHVSEGDLLAETSSADVIRNLRKMLAQVEAVMVSFHSELHLAQSRVLLEGGADLNLWEYALT